MRERFFELQRKARRILFCRRERMEQMRLRRHNCKPALFVKLLIAVLFFFGSTVRAEDGYRLWLRYGPLTQTESQVYRQRVASLVVTVDSATMSAIRAKLSVGCSGLLG